MDKVSKRLSGLARLGDRLRELRHRADLSQMELAARMGFKPSHGYKYVLRLEKGTVPNPTLRTIIAFARACGSDWSDLVEFLPEPAGPEAARPRPARAEPHPSEPVEPPSGPAERPRRDPRPQRLRIRSELSAARAESSQRFWTEVARIEGAVRRRLREQGVVSSSQHDYLALVRPCCSVIRASGSARPSAVARELASVVEPAVEKGLRREIVEQIRDVCLDLMKGAG